MKVKELKELLEYHDNDNEVIVCGDFYTYKVGEVWDANKRSFISMGDKNED